MIHKRMQKPFQRGLVADKENLVGLVVQRRGKGRERAGRGSKRERGREGG